MTQFQKYRNKETGEIVEVEAAFFTAIEPNDDHVVFDRLSDGRRSVTTREIFNNNYELIKDND